ncbi:uncharacterized protein G2W53_017913 [Senna tora]|uniref:Uncharacterized protein n=1 Tax=Senna tora TaxID=362788 RepID=A0A834TS38_9FABA|nr:uncharacterized protein G2W53_017913 [Senna tora]
MVLDGERQLEIDGARWWFVVASPSRLADINFLVADGGLLVVDDRLSPLANASFFLRV